MLRDAIQRSDFRTTRLWSIIQTAAITLVLVRLAPVLFSFLSVGWNGASFVAALGHLTRVPDAIETTWKEKEQVESEKQAFEGFAAKIRQLNATDDRRATAHGIPLRDPAAPAADSTATVRDLYRETVMSVDHYEAEYGESLQANIAAELGPDLGTAITTTDTLNQPLQRALARTSESAAYERAEFESLVESELQSLTTAKKRVRNATDTLDNVRHRDFGRRPSEGLQETIEQLQTVEQECESLIADRQAEYDDAPEPNGVNFRDYLYAQYEWTHPVVGDALDVIETVREVEQRLLATVFDIR
jgi:hypothetical protein